MNAVEAIKNTIQTADMVCGAYLGDLTDEDLMRRPHAGCNHLNWQIGHLIAADNEMANGCVAGTIPELPAGFSEKYSKDAAANNDPSAFHTKAELMNLFEKQRAAIFAALDKMTETDLDQPAPEAMRAYAPTFGAVFNMLGAHWLMHAGQWVIIRREVGRDIVI